MLFFVSLTYWYNNFLYLISWLADVNPWQTLSALTDRVILFYAIDPGVQFNVYCTNRDVESFKKSKLRVNTMIKKRKIEIFSAGCPLCREIVSLVQRMSCPSCEVSVVDMRDIRGMTRAREVGVRSVPAVAINGTLADCCAERGPDPATLRAAGVGRPLD